MKKSIAAFTAVAALSVAGTALAFPPAGMGPGQTTYRSQYTEQYRKFAQETLPIRQELSNKHFEMQKEFLKDKPDAAVISKLQGEVAELRKQMIDAHLKAGLPMGKMGKPGKRGHKKPRGGMMGGMMEDCRWMAAPPAPVPPPAPAK